jgi:hypothetical protein
MLQVQAHLQCDRLCHHPSSAQVHHRITSHTSRVRRVCSTAGLQRRREYESGNVGADRDHGRLVDANRNAHRKIGARVVCWFLPIANHGESFQLTATPLYPSTSTMPALPQTAFLDLFPQILPFVSHLWGLLSFPFYLPYYATQMGTRVEKA